MIANFVAVVNNFYDGIRRFSHPRTLGATIYIALFLYAAPDGKTRQRRSRVGRNATSQKKSHSAATPARDKRDR